MKIASLTVLLLVVAASSTPTFHKKYRGIFPGWKVIKGHNRVVGFPYPCIKGYGVLGHLGYLARGVRGERASNALDILRAVAGYKLPGTIDGSLNIIVELGRACGILVDVIIPGLGLLFSNLVIGLSRILVCVLGSPSFFGVKFGDRRPGYGSASENYFICQPNYGSKWGWKLFLKGYKNPNLILDSYGIRHAGLKADKLIKKATKGRGIDSLPYAHRLIVLWIRQLCDLADRDFKQWNKNDLIRIHTTVTSIIGGFGRSCQRGLGVRIAAGINVYIQTNFENYGLSGVGDALATINANIGKFDQNSFGNVIISFDGDFVDDNSKDDNTDAVVAKDDEDSDDTAVTVATPTYDGSLKGIAKLLVRILNFKINLANDVFSLVFRLCFGISGLIDAAISGLGSLLSRIIAVIIKIGICFKGFPGDRSICNKGWNQQFDVSGEASNAAELIVLFKLGKVQAEVDGYIKSWTKGKGTKAVSGSMRIILESCSSLSAIITNYQKITKDTITNTFISVTTMTAAIANANKRDSGKQITRLIPVCGQKLKEQGYPDITNQVTDIEIIIKNANDDKTVDWTKDAGTNKDLDNGDNDNDDNTGNDVNNNNNSDNTGNNNDNTKNGGNNNSGDNNNNGNDKDNGKGKGTGNDAGKDKDTGNDKDNGKGKGTGTDTGKDKDTGNDKDNGKGKGTGTDTGKDKDTGNDKDNGKGKGTGTNTGKDKDTGNDKDNGKGKGTGTDTGKDKDTGNDKDNGKGKGTGTNTGKDKDTGNDKDNGKDKGTGTDTGKDKDTGNDKDNGNDKGTGTDTGKDKDTGNDKDNGKGKGTGTDTGKDKNTGNDKDNGKGKGTGTETGKDKDTGNDKDNGKGKGTGTDTGKDKDTGNDKDNGKGKGTGNDTGKDKDTGNVKDNGKDKGTGTDTAKDKDTGNDKDNGKGKGTGKDDNNGNNTGGNNGNNTGNNNNNASNGDNTGNKDNNTGGGQGSGGTDVGGSVTIDIGGLISNALKGLSGVNKLYSSCLTDIVNIKFTSFVDVLNLSVNLCLGLGGVIESVFVALGSIFSRLVAVILKIAICVNNFPGNRGICNKAWNAKFGINGDAHTAKDIVALFRVRKCKSEVQDMINTYSGGKGISATPIPIVFQNILDLCDIVTSLTITKQHVSTSFIKIFTIFGAITNSYQTNLGSGTIQKIIPVCSRYFVNQGYPDITVQQQTIITTINVANNNGKVNWKSGTKLNGGGSTDIVKGDGLVTGVKDLFKDVKKHKNVDQTTVTAVLNIEIPRNFEALLAFGCKIIQALGSIIDLFISGLGSLLVRIFGCILRYIVCVSGGARNSNTFVCQKAYFDSFGVTVSGEGWDDLVNGFKVKDALNDVNDILNAYTRNKGRSSLSGCTKICFDQIDVLVKILLKGSKISDGDMTTIMWSVTTLLGGFANSWSADLGKQICDNMIPVTNSCLTKNNYPAFTSPDGIYVTIKAANGVEAPWTKGTTTTVVNN